MSKKSDFEIERFEHNGFTCVICSDPDPPDPREWDNLTTIACWHPRANLGDKQIRGMGLKDVARMVRDDGDKLLAILPLYLYQHSGMTMRVGSRGGNPFTCLFDSGQVGWGYVTKKQAEKMGCTPGQKFKTREGEEKTYDRAFFETAIQQEVSTYDDFLTGSVYGYEVLDEDGDHVDSCWGHYCGEEGLEYVRRVAREAAESAKKPGHTPSACNVSCSEGASP